MSAPPIVLDLVARFEQQLDGYRAGAYNETQLRRDFLDPLFKALGWDMDNAAGYAEAYRDVIHEDATRYNSGLFHFRREKDRHEAPDELTLGLELDDAFLRDLFKSLYYPDSSYEFSAIPADILGQVYEQLLGQVVRLTEGHRAVVDEKPEVRKAGGVYYTPSYVAEYIVRETVGRLIGGICGTTGFQFAVPGVGSLPGGGSSTSLDRSVPHPGALAPEAETPSPASRVTGRVQNLERRGVVLPPPVGEGRGEGEQDVVTPRAAQRILDRVAQLRILDPACGSGSFLICAYQFLLDWHLEFYLGNDPEQWAKGRKPALIQTKRGWRLTIAERKRILVNSVFGVDLDPQAVEVTKLSLLLKVLEGETSQTIAPLFSLFRERALPDLGDNIKCGNSLIGPDFYRQTELPLLTDDERLRLSVFDWATEFPHILRRQPAAGELREPAAPLDYTMPGVPLHGPYTDRQRAKDKPVAPPEPVASEWEGGFDAVIGNPPYVRQESISELKPYFESHYEAFEGTADLYAYFIEKGVKLLREGGLLSVIVSSSFLRAAYGQPLRRTLGRLASVVRIVDFGGLAVFPNAKDTYVCIPLLQKGGTRGRAEIAKVKDLSFKSLAEYVNEHRFTIPASRLSAEAWALKSDAEASLFASISRAGTPLGVYVQRRFFRGLLTGFNEAFELTAAQRAAILRASPASKPLIKRFLGGQDIRRYRLIYQYMEKVPIHVADETSSEERAARSHRGSGRADVVASSPAGRGQDPARADGHRAPDRRDRRRNRRSRLSALRADRGRYPNCGGGLTP